MAKSGGTAVISTSREKIAQFKEDRPEINAGTFENIKEQPVPKQYEPQKLIRSHLPVKHAIKMGAGSLKTKPVRLVFTILLSVVAFVLFGLASTLMLFDGREVSVQSFTDSNINYISLGKVYYVTQTFVDGDSSTDPSPTKFTEKEYEDYAKRYGGAIPMVSYSADISNFDISDVAQSFYSTSINGLVPASDNLKLLAGRLPIADDEAAITDFMFHAFTLKSSKFVYGENNTQLNAKSYKDILYSESKPITLKTDDKEFKIVGVFKGMNVPNNYNDMQQAADNNHTVNVNYSTSYSWGSECENGLYMTLAVADDVFKAAAKRSVDDKDYDEAYFNKSINPATISASIDTTDEIMLVWKRLFWNFALYEGDALKIYGLDGAQKTSLGAGETAINMNSMIFIYSDALYDFVSTFDEGEYKERLDQAYTDAYKEYNEKNALLGPGSAEFFDGYDNFNQERYDEYVTQYNAARIAYAEAAQYAVRSEQNKKYLEIVKRFAEQAEANYCAENPEPSDVDSDEYRQWQDGLDDVVNKSDPISICSSITNHDHERSLEDAVAVIGMVTQIFDELNIKQSYSMSNSTTSEQTVKISAFFIESAYDSCYMGADLYAQFYSERKNDLGPTYHTKYKVPEGACLKCIFIPYDGSRGRIQEFLNKSEVVQKDDSGIKIKNSIFDDLEIVIYTASTLETAFIISGLVLALFAFLLMFNFISASITAKKKDIGILRAIGARTIDVFKIFISEAFIIALICFVISAVGTFGLCILLNSILAKDAGLSVSIFVFGPLSVLSVFGIALITAIISTVIPVGIYSRKPPISSIRAL